MRHILTIQEYGQKEIPSHIFMDDDYNFPTHCIAMSYTINPDLPDGSFFIDDSKAGDRPHKKHINPIEPQACASAMAIGVIGGSDKPTYIAFGGSNQGRFRAVCSSLYFKPIDTVRWQVTFYDKPCADMSIKII